MFWILQLLACGDTNTEGAPCEVVDYGEGELPPVDLDPNGSKVYNQSGQRVLRVEFEDTDGFTVAGSDLAIRSGWSVEIGVPDTCTTPEPCTLVLYSDTTYWRFGPLSAASPGNWVME